MAVFKGFVGPAYASRSSRADFEECIDYYLELIAEGGATPESPMALYQRPGLRLFCTLPTSPLRCLWAGENRLFAVAGQTLYEVFQDGTSTALGNVGFGPGPAHIFPNGTQLFIVSNGTGYLADGSTVDAVIPAVSGAFLDSYFIAAQPGSNKFLISGNNNGRSWEQGLDFGVKQGYPDHIAGLLATHKKLWIFGYETMEPWDSSGDANFPFSASEVGFIEQGCMAPDSIAEVDNNPMWLGGDSRGPAIVWRAQGYEAVRASTFAVERAIQSYGNVGDAIGYSYQDQGHSFYVLSFPSAQATWVYDSTISAVLGTPIWHQRQYWNNGISEVAIAQYHAYTLGKHFVGGNKSGKIYQQSIAFTTDDGVAIRRVRTSPRVSNEEKMLFFKELRLNFDVGMGLDSGQGSDPQAMIQWSNDGGKNWTSERMVSLGQGGDYTHQMVLRQLGQARSRIYRVVVTDPVQAAIMGAYQELGMGNGS